MQVGLNQSYSRGQPKKIKAANKQPGGRSAPSQEQDAKVGLSATSFICCRKWECASGQVWIKKKRGKLDPLKWHILAHPYSWPWPGKAVLQWFLPNAPRVYAHFLRWTIAPAHGWSLFAGTGTASVTETLVTAAKYQEVTSTPLLRAQEVRLYLLMGPVK